MSLRRKAAAISVVKAEREESVVTKTTMIVEPASCVSSSCCDRAESFVNRRVAKHFPNHGGLFYGTIVRFTPASETDETVDLYGVAYDDGDSEDFDVKQVELGLKLHDQHASSSSTTRRVTMSPPNDGKLNLSDEEEDESLASSEDESSQGGVIDLVSDDSTGKGGTGDTDKDSTNETKANMFIDSDSEDSLDAMGLKPTFSNGISMHPRMSLKRAPTIRTTRSASDVAHRRSPRPLLLDDSSSSDEEIEKRPRKLMRNSRKPKSRKPTKYVGVPTTGAHAFLYSDNEFEADLSDSDASEILEVDSDADDDVVVLESVESDDDSDLCSQDRKLKSKRKSPSIRNDYTGPPPPKPLTLEVQSEKLATIEDDNDRYLQQLLYQAGFQFILLKHQFEAVRKIAGVPPDFPLHSGSLITPKQVNMKKAMDGLEHEENVCKTKGVLVADEMGLGKTVEAIAGAILRNEMAVALGEKKRPTLIVSPNDAVQLQWRDTLIQNGVSLDRIIVFQKAMTLDFDEGNFILMTRYIIQSEVKEVFGYLALDKPPRTTSALFPHADKNNLERLQNQYLSEKGKTKNKFRKEGELVEDCVTRLVGLCRKRMEKKKNFEGQVVSEAKELVFETVLIDEAHLMKNRLCYWTMGAALMCVHAKRRVPLTGTPYNNGPSDIATIMGYIDEAKQFSTRKWWDRQSKNNVSKSIALSVTSWRNEYLLRRLKEDVLKGHLPPKKVECITLNLYLAEMSVYLFYEEKIARVINEFCDMMRSSESNNPLVKQKMQEMYAILMALMSCMRSANIHNLVPGGRELTKMFSPSRRHLLGTETTKSCKTCVYCSRSMRPTISIPVFDDVDPDEKKKKKKRRAQVRTSINLEDDDLNDDDDELDEEDEDEEELVLVPADICHAHDKTVKHYAHPSCIEKMESSGSSITSCPRCIDITRRVNFHLPGEENVTYCKHISVAPDTHGFTQSSKIKKVIDWYRNEVPQDDKLAVA